ncbi:MAG: prephenate dehydratase domain-containing protein [Candidatus Neomarinimicrobiota bacterium]|nr:prephenate dehydratase [Candidatus Neomarinimicrobiota bacterium]MBH51512.1 prephenate dehydratase [Candidatus Neomarinimicrobiota bacterium]MDP6877066.1 prephenate dehydratase domain-containing protein [Candidatus Neomarinimicrobiota bacterium]MEC7871805.1 prephenate dehydratase domain-containing protein [Candidatus Neomarinimicrobiota bacterium]MEC9437069.1 prephenate dehydratase domain-containing protein [Candidatus Neomarinimicrobiota bacterium]|tara:strand:+ start:6049 stop:6612 length:564 start_codon:yes stop_codon:yes gene_type:complete
MKSIGIQGGKGSFSEQAATQFAMNHGIDDFNIVYQISSESVLGGLESDETDYGVIAMENAQGGVVIESVEALARYRCSIIEMFHIPVDQNLLGIAGMNVGDITEIHSHQQALRQCKDFLSEHFWTRPLIEEDDTAESARRLSEGKLPKTAGVIANKACAELYDLEILQESIHDLKHNLTLFLGVKKL